MQPDPINGIPFIVNEFLPKSRWEQFRFPRSRKARIRKKWRKNARNWREIDLRGTIWMIDGTACVRPELAELLKVSASTVFGLDLSRTESRS